MSINKLKLTSLVVGVCALLGTAACDDETSDSPDSGAEGGRVSRAGSGGKGGNGAADAGSQDASAADSGGSDDGGRKGGAGGAGGSSSGDDTCFDGEPTETKHFLNRCTDSECEAFDNAERLPLLEGGKLPALP